MDTNQILLIIIAIETTILLLLALVGYRRNV
jgi:LPXTG-motif cell wall-anchored protein